MSGSNTAGNVNWLVHVKAAWSRLVASGNFFNNILAGIAGAIVALPLSIGFALIAGVPSEVMIAASIYAAIFNFLFARSKYGVGGPNTAVALITGAAVSPYAPRDSDIYLGYVLTLCLLVGVFQLILSAILRKADLMDYVSATVIDGLTVGIGLIFVLSSINWAVGFSPEINNQWIVFNAYAAVVNIMEGGSNSFAAMVSAATIAAGVLCWFVKPLKNFAVLVAFLVGFALSLWLNSVAHTRIDQVGWLDLKLFKTSLPDLRPVSWHVIVNLIGPALAIALIGALQTLSIAKGLRDRGDEYDPAKETLSQGAQHVFMAFFHGAPVSNSFNKSALQRDLHGGKWALLMSALVTVVLVENFGGVVAAVPMPALAGCMILVGLNMMNPWKHRVYFRSGGAILGIFVVAATSSIVLGIMPAVFLGALLSIILHFVKFAAPDVQIIREDSGTLRIRIAGPFFFVSGAKLNKQIQREVDALGEQDGGNAEVDLRDALIFTRDQIELDWLYRLIDRNWSVVLVCMDRHRNQIETLKSRGALPAECKIAYVESQSGAISRGVA